MISFHRGEKLRNKDKVKLFSILGYLKNGKGFELHRKLFVYKVVSH